ncbi:hypothetical protein [Lachnoclostridium sp. Marseille-P6806]|uniref:hypothetical protein n=1 Tax=Lachnoclostridium sp. Marseille-P6806 TaxID=2364793 RepID=UPI001030CEE2|nr:hypothetical protein [Lachnoclostridium sp. Marseille-P6806]
MRRKIQVTLLGALLLLLFTGCSLSKFIATGQEFSQICSESGLAVGDVKAHYADDLGYTSVIDAYMATEAESRYVIQYVRFSDPAEAEAFYTASAANMDGEELITKEYSTKSETIDTKSRRLLMEGGRILYAEGDAKAINEKLASLTAGWEKELAQ